MSNQATIGCEPQVFRLMMYYEPNKYEWQAMYIGSSLTQVQARYIVQNTYKLLL